MKFSTLNLFFEKNEQHFLNKLDWKNRMSCTERYHSLYQGTNRYRKISQFNTDIRAETLSKMNTVDLYGVGGVNVDGDVP